MIDTHTGKYWVFGYGSLMWRPGFKYIDRHLAKLNGFHRSLCVYSHVHRGTPDKPGLVFGLDQGGACTGIAYSVAPENWPEISAYLQQREQVTAVYLDSFQEVSLSNNGHSVTALTFLVDRNHEQYAGKLSIREQLKFIRQGSGQSGKCLDYVMSSAHQLADINIHDHNIQTLAKTLSPAP